MIADQAILEDSTLMVPFTISDWETPADQLTVSAFASNTNLLPSAALVLGGAGASRTLTLTPSTNSSGVTTITVQVSDGSTNATRSFQLMVTAVNLPPTLAQVGVAGGSMFSLNLQGEAGKVYTIEASTNLVQWVAFRTVTNVGSSVVIDLEDVRTNSQRFFRARIP